MKHGFRLLIHKSLSEEQKKWAKEVFKGWFIDTNGIYKMRNPERARLRRGILGMMNYSEKPRTITIRRLSTKRRIFGAIPISLLEGKEGPIDTEGCVCGIHSGGQKVKLKESLNESDYEIFYETGYIKG